MQEILNKSAVETAILDGSQSVGDVFMLAVNILSVIVGIVGVIGIVVVGIQYMTAAGNEEQTRKAKRRLFEIVIGLAAYAATFALLSWLIPNFNSTSS